MINTQKTTSRNETLFFIALMIIVELTVYANSLQGEFVLDDEILIQNNASIKILAYTKSIFTQNICTHEGRNYFFFRPLQLFSYMLDYQLWELNPFGFHLTNVLLHILTALVLYYFIYFLFLCKQISKFFFSSFFNYFSISYF